jgi:amidase
MAFAGYASYDGMGLAELVRRGEVSAAELVEEAIARIERHNPTLNAVVFELYDLAREAAKRQPAPGEGGPFQGVPFLLKDILGDHEGVPSTSAVRMLKGIPMPVDAELTRRFKRAGFIPLGKTNVPEIGTMPTTESHMYGPARSPWNPDHSTGGSSGGSAAAVAAGIVPIAHANDGGGSIRVPASCCGLVGMKPTRARNPLGPLAGDLMSGFVMEHVVSRSVRDSAAVLDCTAGPDVGDPYAAPPPERPYLEEVERDPGQLRIAFWPRNLDGSAIHAECDHAVRETAAALEGLGHRVEEAVFDVDMEELTAPFMAIWAAGAVATIESIARAVGREPKPDDFEPATWTLYESGKQVGGGQYLMALTTIHQIARRVAGFFETHDAWVSPTLARPPVRIGELDTRKSWEELQPMLTDYLPFTPLFNATGQPAVSLPLHQTADGLPVGVQLVGRFGDEGLLYRLAGQLERACPWHERTPRIWD